MTLQESEGLNRCVNDKAVRAFLDFYCKSQAEEMNRSCAARMRHPSDEKLAAAYAAQAQVYESFVSDLIELERKK